MTPLHHHNGFATVPLTPLLATLRASGADTDTFLQGQLSSDLRRLDAAHAQLSSYNSPKGRMLAAPLLMRGGDGSVDIELPRGLLEPVAKRLRMYVLRSKVVLSQADEAALGLRGADAAERLAQAGLPAPASPMDVAQADGVRVLRRHGELSRFSLHGAPEKLEALSRSWAAAPALPAEQWQLDDVLAGLPAVLPETQDRFVPQMANLDLLGGVAFDKGCYTGQEIVARLHYLGQLKRRMFLCFGEGQAPAAGSAIHDGDQAQAVGDIVLAMPRPEGGFAASAVLQIGHAESDRLRVEGATLSRPQAYRYAS